MVDRSADRAAGEGAVGQVGVRPDANVGGYSPARNQARRAPRIGGPPPARRFGCNLRHALIFSRFGWDKALPKLPWIAAPRPADARRVTTFPMSPSGQTPRLSHRNHTTTTGPDPSSDLVSRPVTPSGQRLPKQTQPGFKLTRAPACPFPAPASASAFAASRRRAPRSGGCVRG